MDVDPSNAAGLPLIAEIYWRIINAILGRIINDNLVV
jgi:hypothetical protein